MKEKLLWPGWGCLYILCVGLGMVDEPEGVGKVLLMLTSLIFFLPPAALLYLGIRDKNARLLRRVRTVAMCSLGLTLALLVANMFTVSMSETAGTVLHELLGLVSAPMLCSQFWVGSLFLWACVLFGAIAGVKKLKVAD